MRAHAVTCSNCGGEAVVKSRPISFHHGGPAITILNVPTVVCRECETSTYTEETYRAVEQLRKEADRPYTVTATVDYAKAAEAWGTAS